MNLKRRLATGYLGAVSALGEGRQPENQWTAVLAATLRASPALLRGFLEGVGRRRVDPSQWAVRREHVQGTSVRLDLVLIGPGGEEVVVEVKRGSALTLVQLLRYRSRKRFLVALTEHHPEPTLKALRKARVRTLRWADVHELATKAKAKDPRERFVLEQLADYLEEAGVAHHRVTKAAINDLHNVLRELQKKMGTRTRGIGRAFETASALTAGFADLRRELVAETAQGAHWQGPGLHTYTFGYFRRIPGRKREEFIENAKGFFLGCSLVLGRRGIDVGFLFPTRGQGKPYFETALWDRREWSQVGPETTRSVAQLMSKGELDWGKVVEVARKGVRASRRYLNP